MDMTDQDQRLDLDQYLPYLINRVGSVMALRFGEDVLAPVGLSIVMWRVLVALSSTGEQRHTDLAGLTSIEISTLSRVVTRLVRMGLVARAPSKTSGREVAVALSNRGRDLVNRLIPFGLQYETLASSGLSEQEITTLRGLLRRIYANLVEAEPLVMEPPPKATVRATARAPLGLPER
ncbi:MAG: winged helix-turn-helix transcriptional regulator [Xanthobacteraceae bacterium]|nr:winged helix-turn-helix transcriptional regulator [Xanthobacteraceae bacterium]